MDDYKPNSRLSKENAMRDTIIASPTKAEKPIIKSVIQGGAVLKKKGGINKLVALLGSENISDLKRYVVDEVVIPNAQTFLLELAHSVIMGGNGKPHRKNGYSNASYNDYNSAYSRNKTRDREQLPARVGYDDHDISFDNRGDAERVLDELLEEIERYGQASVADLYEFSGITTHNNALGNYGWTEKPELCRVRGTRDGYILEISRAKPINNR